MRIVVFDNNSRRKPMTEDNQRHHLTPRWVLIAAALAIATGTLVAACGQSTPQSATPNTAATTAPISQRMITNQGHKLAFYLAPGHLPAIVLDSGGGLNASYWKNFVPALAAATGSEIVTYDRAGLGASDEVPGPWQPADAASDLYAGLTQLGVTHDAVLVSHSEAGEIAAYFVREHPGIVAGAVLVDATVPEFYTPDEINRIVAAEQPQIAALKNQPSTKTIRQLQAVAADFVPLQTAYHLLTWPTGVPAVVIVSAKTPFPTSPLDAQRWRTAQAAFAAAAPNRTLVTASGSSHDVPIDRPDIVIRAIQTMVGRIR
jgi:pimeloyl-ACP methyl ester carboxylesterase